MARTHGIKLEDEFKKVEEISNISHFDEICSMLPFEKRIFILLEELLGLYYRIITKTKILM